jgi:hypothetical protein
VTVVGSNNALVQGGWLKEGRRENDDETARRADFIVTNGNRWNRNANLGCSVLSRGA